MVMVIIAGNLSSYKVGYVYELPHDVKFDLYGINYTGASKTTTLYIILLECSLDCLI